MRQLPQWRWHPEGVFVRKRGEANNLWRGIDHEGEVPEVYLTQERDRAGALNFIGSAMKRCGNLEVSFTDKLRSHGAAMTQVRRAPVSADASMGQSLQPAMAPYHGALGMPGALLKPSAVTAMRAP